MKKKKIFQVEYWTRELCGAVSHASRVFADSELDAECKIADRYPDGYGFYATEPSGAWRGHY